MSGKGWSVGRVAEVAGFARAATRGRDERISAHVLVDPEAPRQLVLAVREALMPVRPTSEVVVCPLEGAVPGANGSISPTSGSPPPHSHFETVLSLMESRSASCRWVRPSSLRRAAMNRPVFA